MSRPPKLIERPPWDQTFLVIAHEVSKRSTCARMQAGAVLVKDNRIISMGYNGSPPDSEHCRDHWVDHWVNSDQLQKKFWGLYSDFIESEEFYSLHHEWSVYNEIHAEQNAILFAAKNGIKTDNSTLYVTHSPCIDCAKSISQAGIIKVVFSSKYDRSSQGIEFLQRVGIDCQEGY